MKKSGLADSPFFARPTPEKSNPIPPPDTRPAKKRKRKNNPPAAKAVYQSTNQSTNRLTDRPIDPSVDQSTNSSTELSTSVAMDVDTLGPVVDRPRAFYITQKVDHWLDEAVRYLKERGLHKADRSVLVNALLHDKSLFTPEALDQLRPRLLTHLTNKSLKRVQSTGQSTNQSTNRPID